MSLIPVNIIIGEITVRDIIYEELPQIHRLLNESDETKALLGKKESFQFEEIKERYLESLSSVSDFFLGVYLKEEIIGILKGRFENRSCTEVWFLTYVLSERYRKRGFGSKILSGVEEWFGEYYSIYRFCVLAYEDNSNAMEFWNKNNYKLLRRTNIKHPSKTGAVVILEKTEDKNGLKH
ncbi:GNAT family N-acetyltransferase [Clostridium cylindrosporum]|uniref:N-acetyltransferase domain-containing protein n=1 Tax=Clostridium cylindrosporum DSM 605 TaxID=1121307 RepID=A0A0J8G1A8_CLOCY|nr:GNAT family N-acetyltransferase [Clostridium cylindrosporum]KMT21531.1 hypothetical protein CLCY_2c02930 [Clostridium cylindrosporum DSM 605]